MNPKPNKRIDKLLGEIGLSPHSVDPDELIEAHNPFAATTHLPSIGPCGKTCFCSEAAARKSGNRIKQRGANTSFLRSYFCPECKAWHLTSGKNHLSKQSTQPKRNAGHNRRKHNQVPSSDES